MSESAFRIFSRNENHMFYLERRIKRITLDDDNGELVNFIL